MEDSKESRLRAEFEAWFSGGGEYPQACQRGRDGEYLLLSACNSWTAWQAASASRSEILEALKASRTAFASIANGIPAPYGYAKQCAETLSEILAKYQGE